MPKLFTKKIRNTVLFPLVALLMFFASDVCSDGLPGEYYVTQRWRDLFARHSPSFNPAFMTEVNYITLRGALNPSLGGSFLLHEVGVVVPIGLYMSVGASHLGVSSSEKIQPTIWDEATQSIIDDPSSGPISGNQYLGVLSWAMNPINRLSVGINGSFFSERNFDDKDYGVTFDVGLSWRVLKHSLLGDHILGLTFQNLASYKFGAGEAQSQAANIKASWGAFIWEKRIEAGIDLDIKDIMSQSEDFASSALAGSSAEDVAKQIEFEFSSRIGVWLMRILCLYFQVGNEYIGGAIALNVPQLNDGRDLFGGFQYTGIIDDEDLTSGQTVYLRGEIWKHREEVYARRMARLASIGPGNLYNKARTLYSQGKYWDSFFIFGRILTEYPDFFKNDKCKLYLGFCQENLDMRDFSSETFTEAKKDYPRSVIVPFANLGLMRIYYRDGNSSGVSNQFAMLNTSTVPDSLKFHAYYYMGQTHIQNGDYSKAIQLLDLIPETHPEYIFAQHSLAVSAALDNNLPRSLEALDNTLQVVPQTEEQKEIINRSLIFIGYIYYEGLGGQERALSKAVSALRRIPPNSYFYEDALLGLAWTALKASQWSDCAATAKQLQVISKKPVIQCEGMLLEAYVNMMDKKYTLALPILEKASKALNEAQLPTETEKNAKTLEYDKDRGVYYEISSTAKNLALTSHSSYTVTQIDSLATPQKKYEKKLLSYYRFVDEFSRQTFFARGIDQVREDVEYALAKAQKMSGATRVKKDLVKDQEKIDDLDAETKKLEEEIRKLELESGE